MPKVVNPIIRIYGLVAAGLEPSGKEWAELLRIAPKEALRRPLLRALINYLEDSRSTATKRGRKSATKPSNFMVEAARFDYDQALFRIQESRRWRKALAKQQKRILPKALYTPNEIALRYIHCRYPDLGEPGTLRNLISKNRRLYQKT